MPEIKNDSGIYAIINILNGHIYIGSAKSWSNRINAHRLILNRNQHHCKHLQAAWHKYGESNFLFVLLEECNQQELLVKEQFWLDSVEPEYNTAKFAAAPARGKIFTDIEKAKILDSWTEERRAQQAEYMHQHWLSNREGRIRSIIMGWTPEVRQRKSQEVIAYLATLSQEELKAKRGWAKGISWTPARRQAYERRKISCPK